LRAADIYYILFLNEVFMTTQEIYEAIEAATDELRAQHNATTKVSNTRARKAASEISKLVKEYRKASLEENK
jgi:hypothetical protein